jgi:hypothetical protein
MYIESSFRTLEFNKKFGFDVVCKRTISFKEGDDFTYYLMKREYKEN